MTIWFSCFLAWIIPTVSVDFTDKLKYLYVCDWLITLMLELNG